MFQIVELLSNSSVAMDHLLIEKFWKLYLNSLKLKLPFQKLMCCAADVLEGKGTVQVAITVTELLRRHGVLRVSPQAHT